jgi:hypothetical protein
MTTARSVSSGGGANVVEGGRPLFTPSPQVAVQVKRDGHNSLTPLRWRCGVD